MRRLAFVVLSVALIGAVGVLEGVAGQRAAGKTLIVALDQSDVKTSIRGAVRVRGAVHRSQLLRHAAGLQERERIDHVCARLATEWSVSKDGKEYTFKLRKNVKFASGNPFTAEDVRFTLMRLRT